MYLDNILIILDLGKSLYCLQGERIMKKLIAVLLSVAMILSLATSFAGAADPSSLADEAQASFINGLSAAGGTAQSLDNGLDVEAMLQAGLLDNVDMFGVTVDFLYNSTEPLMWSTLKVSKGDVTLAKANVNTYLATCITDMIGDYENVKFCTPDNATKIANFIGHLLSPDFTDIVIRDLNVDDSGFYYDSFDVSNNFYTKIARFSGLTAVIQSNWIDARVNFSPLLYLLGFDFDDDRMLGQSKLEDAERIAPVLVKSVIKKVCQIGPVEYLLQIVSRLAATYTNCMYEPVKALVQPYVSAGTITVDELKTLRGLFNMVSNQNDKTKIDKLQFISAPAYRFASCVDGKNVDTTSAFLYAMFYLTLVGKHETNSIAVTAMKNNVNSLPRLSTDQKNTIKSIYDGLFGNNLDKFVSSMANMFNDNINQVSDTLWDIMINFFHNYWKNITTFFSKLFDSIANFGDF